MHLPLRISDFLPSNKTLKRGQHIVKDIFRHLNTFVEYKTPIALPLRNKAEVTFKMETGRLRHTLLKLSRKFYFHGVTSTL